MIVLAALGVILVAFATAMAPINRRQARARCPLWYGIMAGLGWLGFALLWIGSNPGFAIGATAGAITGWLAYAWREHRRHGLRRCVVCGDRTRFRVAAAPITATPTRIAVRDPLAVWRTALARYRPTCPHHVADVATREVTR